MGTSVVVKEVLTKKFGYSFNMLLVTRVATVVPLVKMVMAVVMQLLIFSSHLGPTTTSWLQRLSRLSQLATPLMSTMPIHVVQLEPPDQDDLMTLPTAESKTICLYGNNATKTFVDSNLQTLNMHKLSTRPKFRSFTLDPSGMSLVRKEFGLFK